MFGILTHLRLHCISSCANQAYCFQVCIVGFHGRSCESCLESVRRLTFRKSVDPHVRCPEILHPGRCTAMYSDDMHTCINHPDYSVEGTVFKPVFNFK